MTLSRAGRVLLSSQVRIRFSALFTLNLTGGPTTQTQFAAQSNFISCQCTQGSRDHNSRLMGIIKHFPFLSILQD